MTGGGCVLVRRKCCRSGISIRIFTGGIINLRIGLLVSFTLSYFLTTQEASQPIESMSGMRKAQMWEEQKRIGMSRGLPKIRKLENGKNMHIAESIWQCLQEEGFLDVF